MADEIGGAIAEAARSVAEETRGNMAESTKVGIISCSGEEIPGGTIARWRRAGRWKRCGPSPP